MGGDFARRWRESDVELYARTTLYLVQKLGSHNFHDPRADGVRHQLAMHAIEKADRMPLELECDLAYQLQRFVDESGESLLGTEAWPAERRRMASSYLHAWGRIERAIDPDWDPEDQPPPFPLMPEVPSGVVPADIKDPEQRKRYEKAIAENEEKKRSYRLQRVARELAERFPARAVRFLKDAYTKTPAAPDELRRLVKAHLTDPATRKRVLSAVLDE